MADSGARDDAADARDGGESLDAAMGIDAGRASEDAGPVDLDTGTPPDTGPAADAGPAIDAGPRTARACLEAAFPPGEAPLLGPDYDRFAPTIGAHCFGTDHQEIDAVERVVFLGDSITVGTPPTPSDEYYRSRLADRLADHFGLEPPALGYETWKRVDILNGRTVVRDAGPFSSCAEWGANAVDLMATDPEDTEHQLGDCFPEDRRDERTLVVMTIGGNDIAAITKAGFEESATIEGLWSQTHALIDHIEQAVEWLLEPGRFPAGVTIVLTNFYEFTDGTGDLESCPAADVGGFGGEWDDPTALREMVVWANEQIVRVAVEHRIDIVFLLEEFCGHGFHSDDPEAPCYRGPDTERFFDVSCTHPTPAGHDRIAEMMMAVIEE
jgi:lysophospholipase L1-like esterase